MQGAGCVQGQLQPARRAAREDLRAVPADADREQRARLRRPAAEDGRAVRRRRTCAARYASRFRFLLVDEYQDTNRPQYLLMRRLAEAHRNICVVGDPDQSIYKWRGADLRNIMDFEADYPDAQGRPPRTELPVHAGDPRRRVGRHQPEPQPQGEAALDRDEGRRQGPLLPGRTTNSRRPTRSRASRASSVRTSGDTPMAVLYRTNAQSRVIEDALRREGIAYRIIGSVRFYERKEVKDTLAYLKLLHQPGRRREPAAGDQRADARDREGRDGRAGRGARPASASPAITACRRTRSGRGWSAAWIAASSPGARPRRCASSAT